MAESVKYNYKGTNIDLADFIGNLNRNAQAYLSKLNWNEALKNEFKRSYDTYLAGLLDLLANNTGRFSTNAWGGVTDSTGELTKTDIDDYGESQYYYDNKGNTLTSNEYNALKDRKKKKFNTFNANLQVWNYINWIGDHTINKMGSTPKTKPSSEEVFDFNKHGFFTNWLKLNNPTGELFNWEPYLEKDALNEETGVRDTVNRAAYLREQIENYANNLGDYNFSNTIFKNKEAYQAKLREAAKSLENGYDVNDVIALNLAGIGNDFLNKFFATGKVKPELSEQKQKLKETQEELKKLQELKQLEEAQDKVDKEKYNIERDNYLKQWAIDHPWQEQNLYNAVDLSYSFDKLLKSGLVKGYKEGMSDEEVKDVIKSFVYNANLTNRIRNYINADKETLTKLNENGEDRHIANNLDLLAQINAYIDPRYTNDKGESILKDGYWVLPDSENSDDYSFIAYNPTLRKYQIRSMLSDDLLKLKMAYNTYDKVQKKQIGGLLEYHNKSKKAYLEKLKKAQELQNKIDKEVEETGESKEKVTAKYRKPEESGFTSVEKARISAAAMDIGAAISAFIPGYGTVASGGLSALSTLANIGADIADDSLDGMDVAKNIGYNLLWDVAGLVPGYGVVGKTSKIARSLKSLAPKILAGFSLYNNGGDAITAFNKLMNNPKELTVKDWQSLSDGLTMLAGGARYAGTKRAINRNSTSKDIADVKTSTGKTVTITKDQLDKIRKTKGLDSQNEIFSDATGGQKLLKEFKSRFGINTSGPEVSKRTEVEFLPFGENKNNWKRDEYWLSWLNREKTSKPKSETSKPVNSELVRALTALKKADMFRLKAMDSNPNYLFRKNGGILDRIKKFDGGGVTNTSSKANWFEHIFNSNEFKNWIKTFNKDNYQDFNNLQTSWKSNYDEAKYTPGMNPTGIKSLNVINRQKLWNNTGTNAAIERAFQNGLITRPGNTGDNFNGGYTDGYFGELEYLRHGGNELSWKGREKELAEFLKFITDNAGLYYQLNPKTGMYELGVQKPETLTIEPLKITSPKDSPWDSRFIPDELKPEKEISNNSINWGNILNNPTLTYGLPRAMYADLVNRNLTRQAIEAEKVALDKPFTFERRVYSDLGSEIAGQNAAGRLNYLALNLGTSDGDAWRSAALEGLLKGNDAILQGKMISDKQLQLQSELSLQQLKENRKSEHDIAAANLDALITSGKNIAMSKMAYDAKKHNIWDTLLQQIEFDAKTKLKERELLERAFSKSDISQAINANLPEIAKERGIPLTPSELTVWNKLQSGNSSELTPEELKTLANVIKLKSLFESEAMRDYYNIPETKWSIWNKARQLTKPSEPELLFSNKKGGKIDTAKVRERVKNADRFSKYADKNTDRTDKAIERMYKYKSRKRK